jgi:hypothetical protein
MADRAAAKILIGGKLRRVDVRRLAETAESENCGEDYEGGLELDELEDMLEGAAATRQCVCFSHGEKTGAAFDELEELCRSLGLAYLRHSEPYVGSWAEAFSYWEAGMEAAIAIPAHDGLPTVERRRLVQALKDRPAGVVALVTQLWRVERFAQIHRLEIGDPQPGERYRLREAVDLHPAGALGTIVEATPDVVTMRMDNPGRTTDAAAEALLSTEVLELLVWHSQPGLSAIDNWVGDVEAADAPFHPSPAPPAPAEPAMFCQQCGAPMFYARHGIAHHGIAPDEIDHEADADHVALADAGGELTDGISS